MLPSGYHAVRRLAGPEGTQAGTSPRAEVWLAEKDGRRVVVRLERGAEARGGQGAAELAVLASVEHEHLARLCDHGALPGGGRFLAREWIEGEDLASWVGQPSGGRAAAPRRSVEEIGRVLAEVALALHALHRAGFVHGDLKARNVFVDAAGKATLSDFGLARRAGAGARGEGVSGSVFAIAPEVLFGEAPDERADLFALGALIVEVFGGLRATAREFYARFPAQDFFAAAGSRASDLPASVADLAARLLERDASLRPRSAAEIGALLCARFSLRELARRFDARDERPRAGARALREAWFEALVAELVSAAAVPGTLRPAGGPRLVLGVAAGDDVREVARELALLASLRGLSAAHAVVPRGLAEAERERWLELELARWSDARTGALAVFAVQGGDPGERRAVEQLARSLPARVGWVVVGPRGLTLDADRGTGAPVSMRELPPVELAAIEALVERWLPAESAAARAAFARALHAASGGGAARLERVLERAVRRGVVLAGGRLRAEPPVSASELAEETAFRWEDLEAPEQRIAAVLALARGRASLAACLEAQDGDAALLRRALASLEARGLVRRAWVSTGGSAGDLAAAGSPASALAPGTSAHAANCEWTGGLDPARVPPEARRRAARVLARRAEAHAAGVAAEGVGGDLAAAAWRHVADELDARSLAAALATASDRGAAEAVIAAAEQARWALGAECAGPVLAELALAHAQAGDPERALELAAGLERSEEMAAVFDRSAATAARAAAARVRGRVALQRHEPEEALACFDRARADRADGGEALLARVQLASQLGRDEEVLALAAEARAESAPGAAAGERADGTAWAPRVARSIAVFAAMSRLRMGAVELARAELERELQDARRDRDAQREAALSMNLGTLERRAGNLARALEHFERADDCATATRSATLSAQIRGSFAALLREQGELVRAEAFALSALALRQRLGDHAGAQVARGVLALVLAERGHVGRAAIECDLAAAELARSGRPQDAGLLACVAIECRARLGLPAPDDGDAGAPASAGRSAVPGAPGTPGTPGTRGARAGEGDPRALFALARAAAYSGSSERAVELARRAEDLAGRLGLNPVRAQVRAWRELLLAPRDPPPIRPAEEAEPPLSRLDRELQALFCGEPFDVAAARTLAAELERRGRDDRLTRLLLALAARSSEIETSRSAHAAAEAGLARCALGAREGTELASPSERGSRVEPGDGPLRHNLLAVPDPWPEDHVLARTAATEADEHEMDVLRLLEINHRLVEKPSLAELLGEIVESALSVSGGERGFLVLEEDGELEFDTALDSRRGDIPAPEVEVSRSILSEALAAMRPLRLSNAADDPALGAAASVIALELRSVLCVPFRVEKGVRGVIYLDHRLKRGAFTERAERMVALLADQASLAIAQVRRMEEIRRLNRRLNQRMVEAESELQSNRRALAAAGLAPAASGLVGSSPAMREVHRLIELAARTDLSVLITGPSGSGKELAARAVHGRSRRAEDPFIVENCAALPPALIEAELFGAVRGAYTGADRDRAGLFERADHGTLFLDEIGELPLELQAKLLRVLETGEVRRLGSGEVRKVDVRLVSATNRDLAREVREGRFRADLFYRLEGLRVALPSLESRTEDIPELVDHFLRQSAEPLAAPRKASAAVLARLAARRWPGNVRELRNEVARLALLSPGDLDDPSLISEQDLALSPAAPDRLVTLAELEKDAILRTLRATGGDKNEAARRLGISRAKIYQRLKDWGVG